MKDVDLVATYWTIAGNACPHSKREYSPHDFQDSPSCACGAHPMAHENECLPVDYVGLGFSPGVRAESPDPRNAIFETESPRRPKRVLKGSGSLARIPPRYLLGVELNDGTLECSWSLHEDMINHRRLCGKGR